MKVTPLPDRIVRDVKEGRLPVTFTVADVVRLYRKTKFSRNYLTSVLRSCEASRSDRHGRALVRRVARGTYQLAK